MQGTVLSGLGDVKLGQKWTLTIDSFTIYERYSSHVPCRTQNRDQDQKPPC